MKPGVFSKTLSLNDTGETGAHMAGIHVPKTETQIFPWLDPTIKNPRAALSMKDRNGRSWPLNFIYYNNANFDGTRDEYRLTGLTEFITGNGLTAGDSITVTRTDDGAYFLDFQKADPSATPAQPAQIYLGLPSDVATDSSKVSHDHAMRPAARIIHTIGQHLIKDAQAAVIELVKNAYDADATKVKVQFHIGVDQEGKRVIRISVQDNGSGMTYEQVTRSWLVPATPDKVTRRVSPKQRQLQGNKGIGRFAAFMLGEEVFLVTVSEAVPQETSLILQASDFRKVEFLDQVRVIVDTREAAHPSQPGTRFEMTSREGDEAFREWNKEDFSKLRTDLRRMLFPFRSRKDEFEIWVEYHGFTPKGQPDGAEQIEPLPVLEFFDYRIKADVSADGRVTGLFASPLLTGNPQEALSFQIAGLQGMPCGPVHVDLRVVDRETTALQDLLDRSLAAEDSLTGISRAQLKKLLDESCGVSVYRGDFRIRPYGDNGNDWLELDRQRINNPSLFISNNQTFGMVVIEKEEISLLEEKSDRDGLREDVRYDRLRSIVSSLILELQRRRYEIRRAVGRIQKSTRVTDMLTELKDFEKPFKRISKILTDEGIEDTKIGRIRDILQQDSEGRQRIIAKLEESIAIYQGQATLGKMVGVLLHEGNRSLGILRNQSARMPAWLERLLAAPNENVRTEVSEGLTGITAAAESLTKLFDRIQPLGVRSRGSAHEAVLVKQVRVALRAMAEELSTANIQPHVEIPEDFKVLAWEQDLRAIFLNLTENSIYWIKQKRPASPEIRFRLVQNEDGARLDILDNGPGIPREHIQSEAIFEPHFSLKGGYGLGLPIAGEAAARNGFELKAIHDDGGAHFVLDFNPPRQKQ